MKKIFSIILFILLQLTITAQENAGSYKKTSVMIPMRDGIKLFTVILTPVNATKAVPILIQRTPYGANIPLPDTILPLTAGFQFANMAKEGYIFVFQDIRGKYKSEGKMDKKCCKQ